MRFAILGVAGYIAPRHLKAIKETGNELVAAIDLNDSVGVLDQYFPNAKFYNNFSQFKRHEQVDYISICVPNYLHYHFIRESLRAGMNVICEKPLVIDPRQLDKIEKLEQETGKTVNSILQLRVHPLFKDMKEKIGDEHHKVTLEYITPRGPWYHKSWKGDHNKSGGLVMNIGVHFFDILIWLFGGVQHATICYSSPVKLGGRLELKRASINWFLSIDRTDIPPGKTTHRIITIDGSDMEFSDGFTDLHMEVYNKIMSGEGFRIKDIRQSIELVHKLYESRSKL